MKIKSHVKAGPRIRMGSTFRVIPTSHESERRDTMTTKTNVQAGGRTLP